MVPRPTELSERRFIWFDRKTDLGQFIELARKFQSNLRFLNRWILTIYVAFSKLVRVLSVTQRVQVFPGQLFGRVIQHVRHSENKQRSVKYESLNLNFYTI